MDSSGSVKSRSSPGANSAVTGCPSRSTAGDCPDAARLQIKKARASGAAISISHDPTEPESAFYTASLCFKIPPP